MNPDDVMFEYHKIKIDKNKQDVLRRKAWDKYFLEICNKVSENSKCLSRQVGAILVRDKSIISSGYNGPPRGLYHCWERYALQKDEKLMKKINERIERDELTKDDFNKYVESEVCPRRILGFKSGFGLELCWAGHGERNSIINAARHGIAVKGCKMYCNCGVPCGDCMIEIINSGVEEVIVTKIEFYDEKSEILLKESGINIREYIL